MFAADALKSDRLLGRKATPSCSEASHLATCFGVLENDIGKLMVLLAKRLTRQRDIHVCDAYPSFVDTPGVRHAANDTGARLSYPPGVLVPEKVAAAVVALARRPRPVTLLGAPNVTKKLAQLTPDLIASGMNRFMQARARRADRARNTVDALYAPPAGASGLYSGQRSG